jgi:hypothetical protein
MLLGGATRHVRVQHGGGVPFGLPLHVRHVGLRGSAGDKGIDNRAR